MVRTSHDPEADAVFLWFGPEGIRSTHTEEVAAGIILDFDESGRVIGIEVLDARADGKAAGRLGWLFPCAPSC